MKSSFFNCGIPVAGLEATNVDDVRGLVQGMSMLWTSPRAQSAGGLPQLASWGCPDPMRIFLHAGVAHLVSNVFLGQDAMVAWVL